jgi:hypothetical protein
MVVPKRHAQSSRNRGHALERHSKRDRDDKQA